jgi:hypothetical protein
MNLRGNQGKTADVKTQSFVSVCPDFVLLVGKIIGLQKAPEPIKVQ